MAQKHHFCCIPKLIGQLMGHDYHANVATKPHLQTPQVTDVKKNACIDYGLDNDLPETPSWHPGCHS